MLATAVKNATTPTATPAPTSTLEGNWNWNSPLFWIMLAYMVISVPLAVWCSRWVANDPEQKSKPKPEAKPKTKPTLDEILKGTAKYELPNNGEKYDLITLVDMFMSIYNRDDKKIVDQNLIQQIAIGLALCRDQEIISAVNAKIRCEFVFFYHPDKDILPVLLEEDQAMIYQGALYDKLKDYNTFYRLLSYLIRNRRYKLAAKLVRYTRDSWSSYEQHKLRLMSPKEPSDEIRQCYIALGKRFNLDFIREYPLDLDFELQTEPSSGSGSGSGSGSDREESTQQ
jgi:hypothetical protein